MPGGRRAYQRCWTITMNGVPPTGTNVATHSPVQSRPPGRPETALAASYVPARRAASVDPALTLGGQ